MLLTVFVLACFVGYYVVLKVTPALHAPLMSVTNAISSLIIVAALETTLLFEVKEHFSFGVMFGIFAVFLTSVNIVGGFMITKRMLSMFASKKKTSKKEKEN